MQLRDHLWISVVSFLFLSTLARGETLDAAALTLRIDDRLARAWKQAGVEPAAPVDDAAFLRRVSLDLVGRIPTVAEVRDFLGDRDPAKRERTVSRLLKSGAFANHLATSLRRVWLPQADTPRFAGLADEFENWLAVRIRDKTPYDQLVRELLSVPSTGLRRAGGGRDEVGQPRSFLSANEFLPENLAAATTRAFLGINLECAQCHNHPFARWTRDQFWETAAFFARPGAESKKREEKGPAQGRRGVLELTIPSTNRVVSASSLTGETLDWPERLEADTGRLVLAKWVTTDRNPYFARNAVNRLWAHFFGAGLVEPLDDLSGEDPAGQPELLEELAGNFASSGFDLASLVKALVLSRAYQLRADGSADGVSEGGPRLFARMPVRGLTGEQLYDSLRVAAGLPVERLDLATNDAVRSRRRFAARFLIERPAEAERSVAQALTLLNGKLSTELTDPAKSPTLGAVADAPFLETRGKVETLFLAALGRTPHEDETAPFITHVEKTGAANDPVKAMADVFWVLLNSTEFNTNH